MSLFDLTTDADSWLVAWLDVHAFQLVDDFTDDVIARKPVEAEHDEVQRDTGQLVSVDAVECERLVEHGVQRLTNHACLHLSNHNATDNNISYMLCLLRWLARTVYARV